MTDLSDHARNARVMTRDPACAPHAEPTSARAANCSPARRGRRWIGVAMVAIILSSCAGTSRRALSPTSAPIRPDSVVAAPIYRPRPSDPCRGATPGASRVSPQRYLHLALELTLKHAYFANRIDVPAWRRSATQAAAKARCTAEVYDQVAALIADLEEQHSALLLPRLRHGSGPGSAIRPAGDVRRGIGSLELSTAAAAPSEATGSAYVRTARTILAASACGWILDVRGNAGGNLHTMVSAVAPLLGAGPAISYKERQGHPFTLGIDAVGAVHSSTGQGGAAAVGPLPANAGRLPVAVLQGPNTASAGEGLVLAFRGRRTARTFGVPTSGVPTDRQGYDLPDGSSLLLTSGLGIDQVGVTYAGPIPPDEPSADPVAAARRWLLRQPTCGAGPLGPTNHQPGR
jgi:carboxyl-terminal processing protease